MSSIGHKRENQLCIHQRAPCGKWPSQCASGVKGISCGFWIMKIGPVVSKICPRQIWSHCAFYLGPLGPGYHILHTSKSSSNELDKNVSCESSGNFLQNRRKDDFWPSLAILRVEKTPKYDPWGPIFYKLAEVVPVSWKKLVSCECNGTFYKIDKTLPFGLNLGPIRGQKGLIM